MKRMNLDQTWKACLHTWSIINQYLKLDSHKNCCIDRLKTRALPNDQQNMMLNCHFCEYADKAFMRWQAKQKRLGKKVFSFSDNKNMCSFCPGVKVDPDFNCMGTKYHYRDEPFEFYAKIQELNKIRLNRKKLRRNKCSAK